LTDSLYLLE